MQKRTKIVATLGPASEDPAVLRKMIRAGLDVARINFSHGEADEHRARAAALKQAARDEGRDIGLLGDLQGPKIRVKRFRENSVNLVDGASFFLDSSLGLEDGTVEGLRADVAKNMAHELKQKIRGIVKDRVMDLLIEKHALDIPKAMVATTTSTSSIRNMS